MRGNVLSVTTYNLQDSRELTLLPKIIGTTWKGAPPVMIELSASVKMTSALNMLKAALKDVGMTSTLEVPGTSRILLRLTDLDIAVTCRTNAEAGHQWRFWLRRPQPEPIGPVDDPVAAAREIKRRLASGVAR